ncbi:cobalt-precorrin-7 (C5)-methyltransferase [Methanolinea mesophila]|uniref:cobalt-precorrin-7 (C(5))-methyltransferase n=1 Tax=Methanolinea mesophila TaxID=547055 RepID=UPI001AE741E1|nr:cobalt-precorrin-7 (C(5))-methyltransferase [Methanolinea mesophila]MBP1929603.1 cobalt-precorrin-7 (C5)-methyltransferase [Methanolinea mesophila]
MKIVGVGCGPGMLTEEAIAAIGNAKLIYGSSRAIDLARDQIVPGTAVHPIPDYRSLHTLPDEAVVLSTGDPMLAGLGRLGGEVIPGISSLQVAAARLHLPLVRVAVVDAHGRDRGQPLKDAGEELSRGKIVFLLADPGLDLGDIRAVLGGLSRPVKVYLCQDMGYPGEVVRELAPGELTGTLPGLYSLVLEPGRTNPAEGE